MRVRSKQDGAVMPGTSTWATGVYAGVDGVHYLPHQALSKCTIPHAHPWSFKDPTGAAPLSLWKSGAPAPIRTLYTRAQPPAPTVSKHAQTLHGGTKQPPGGHGGARCRNAWGRATCARPPGHSPWSTAGAVAVDAVPKLAGSCSMRCMEMACGTCCCCFGVPVAAPNSGTRSASASASGSGASLRRRRNCRR